MSAFSVPMLLAGLMLVVWSYLIAAGLTRFAQLRFYGQLGLTRRSAVVFFGAMGIVLIVGSIGLALPAGATRMTLDLVTAGLVAIVFLAWIIYVLRSGRRR